jgi:hypothetical protein
MRNSTSPPDVRTPLSITPASMDLPPNAESTPNPGRNEFDGLRAIHWFMHRPPKPQQLQRLQHQLQLLGVLI